MPTRGRSRVSSASRTAAAVATLRGIRVMASGLAHPQWNGADVTGPYSDLEGARAFYAERDVEWGARVPAGLPFKAGTHLFTIPLMGLLAGGLQAAPAVDGLQIRQAGPEDLETVLYVDTTAFGSDRDLYRPWTEPHLSAERITVAVASLDDDAVGTAYCLRSDGRRAGRLRRRRRRPADRAPARCGGRDERLAGGAAFADGARMAHLQADSDEAARVYARLGFSPAGALDVYVDL